MQLNISKHLSALIFLSLYPFLTVANAAPGDLDGTFGNRGMAVTSPGSGQAIAVQADSKIVAAEDGNRVIRRLANGAIDSTFGSGGTVTVTVPGFNAYINISDIDIDASGRILVTANTWLDRSDGNYTHYEDMIFAYRPDGSVDSAFGSGGIVIVTVYDHFVPSPDKLDTLLVGNKILVAGSGHQTGSELGGAYIKRYNSNGTVDTTFGVNGSTNVASYGIPQLAVQSNGSIILGRNDAYGNGSLTRYSANGILDTTFGNNGSINSVVGVGGVVAQNDDKLVVAGSFNGTLAVARYQADGSGLDSSFGSNGGMTVIQMGPAGSGFNNVSIQTDGKIVAAGNTTSRLDLHGYDRNFYDSNFVVARYLANGAVDTGFGHQGTVTFDYDKWDDYATGMAIQANGKILVIGRCGAGTTKSGPYQWAASSDSVILQYLP